jgi:hypothetical protein
MKTRLTIAVMLLLSAIAVMADGSRSDAVMSAYEHEVVPEGHHAGVRRWGAAVLMSSAFEDVQMHTA